MTNPVEVSGNGRPELELNLVLVIPAYKPTSALLEVLRETLGGGIRAAVVVDDGSGPNFLSSFDEAAAIAGVTVVRHVVNLGKGSALKTGINAAMVSYPDCVGIVTADADGQHLASDILKVARELEAHPQCLVLGARTFPPGVPFRSRFGNTLTKHLLHLVAGSKITDTQTGLRGIPVNLAKLILRIPANGYDFELDVLIRARHQGIVLREIPIETIYVDDNATSHFRPLFDSMKIYCVLFRFGTLALFTTLIDNAVFYLSFLLSSQILLSQAIARTTAMIFNYSLARNAVFLSTQKHEVVFPKYITVVIISGACSYLLIRGLLSVLPIEVFSAKIIAESILFIANFAVLRDFVFRRDEKDVTRTTDWTDYYRKTPPTARLTRRYTASRLLNLLKRCGAGRSTTVIELGGANSCFIDRILSNIGPEKYHVIDNNRYGLDLLRRRTQTRTDVFVHEGDVTNLRSDLQANIVFSIGLIEHFSPEGTQKAIEAHIDLARPGGYVLLSFPTPTLLYRLTRAATESLRMWHFPDERPLHADEVRRAVKDHGEILHEEILWPLIFTQRVILLRKKAASATEASTTVAQAMGI